MRRVTVLTSVVALVAIGVASPAISNGKGATGPGSLRASTFTLYEVSESISIVDETPVRIDTFPPTPQPGRPGVGDVLVLDSNLFSRASFRETSVPPPPIPGLPPVTGPYQTFDPVGDEIGDVLGDCTFVRYIDQRPTFEDRLAQCQLTFRLPQGQITANGLLDVSALEAAQPAELSISGGTGIYSRAVGTVTLTQPSVPAFDRFTVQVSWRN